MFPFSHFPFLLLLLLLVERSPAATGSTYTIHNVTELVDFSERVNSGASNYASTTVFLDSDLDFTGKTIKPIGDKVNCFLGSFNGKGHVISNLNMNSSSTYVGLFGYSTGLTIRNVIIGKSCSIINSNVSKTSAFTGGFLGRCDLNETQGIIENCVNMASVTFIGNVNERSYLGGIVGCFHSVSSQDTLVVKNCVNYGYIRYSGYSKEDTNIGGIVGELWGSASVKDVLNCLNYGKIEHSSNEDGFLKLGGVAGFGQKLNVENCVNAGTISLKGVIPTTNAGSIFGYLSTASIRNCYWAKDLSYELYMNCSNKAKVNVSNCSTFNASTFELDQAIVADNYTGKSLIYALNVFADTISASYSHWILNREGKTVSFNVNDKKLSLTLDSQIILLPNLANEGDLIFDGWYEDSALTQLASHIVTDDEALYGLYGVIVRVILNPSGGSVDEKTKKVVYGDTYGELPEARRDGYTFLGWFTEDDKEVTNETIVSEAGNHALHVKWTPNNYTITFDVNGGNELDEKNISVTYDASYGKLPEATRTGYTFLGWFTEDDKEVTGEAIVSEAGDHTLHAKWTPNNYTVTLDVNGGDELDEKNISVAYDASYGKLPEVRREGYTFLGWFTEDDKEVTSEAIISEAGDHILHAKWELIKYTVTLDVNGGDELAVREIVVAFNSSYKDLPTPTRVGYAFLGWFDDKNESVTNETVLRKTADHTLRAEWKEGPTQVEIVFGRKDLSEEEIGIIVKQYTNDEFTILRIDVFEDEVRTIIRFVDSVEAEEFFRAIETEVYARDSAIKRVGFNSEKINEITISSALCTSPFIGIFLVC